MRPLFSEPARFFFEPPVRGAFVPLTRHAPSRCLLFCSVLVEYPVYNIDIACGDTYALPAAPRQKRADQERGMRTTPKLGNFLERRLGEVVLRTL